LADRLDAALRAIMHELEKGNRLIEVR